RVNVGNLPTAGGLNVRMGNQVFPITDLADAQAKVDQYRERALQAGHGASTTPAIDIVNDAGEVVAHFSYNGRIWKGPRGANNPEEIVLPGKESAKEMFARMRKETDEQQEKDRVERLPHLTQVTLKDGSKRIIDSRDLKGKDDLLWTCRRDGRHREEGRAWAQVERSQIVKQVAAGKPAAKTDANETGNQPQGVDEAAVRTDYQQAMAAKTGQADHDWANNAFADGIVKALNRDPAAIEWARKTLANGLNITGLRVFAKHAGIKMPRSQKGQREAIDAWAGITTEQRAESDAKQAKAKAERKAAEVADKRAQQPIPDFKDYAEALRWADRRAEAFDSKGQYRATAEYREWVDKARPLYEKALAEQQANAKTKIDAAGVKPGDKVRTSQIGAFL